MPDRKTHLGAGALVGVGVGLYAARNLKGSPFVARMLGAVLASVAGAALTDILEPALHSWHRRSFHSWAALAGSAGVTIGPPIALQQWFGEREVAAERARTQREALPDGHPDRAGLWLAEMFEQLLVGGGLRLPAGYASHLVLDAASARGLRPV